MTESYKKYLDNYCNFKGCTSRREYWEVLLMNIIIYFILLLIQEISQIEQMTILEIIFSLSIIVPNVSITVRRLHDINKSGYFHFIYFIPIVGSILMLIYLCTERIEPNSYGERI